MHHRVPFMNQNIYIYIYGPFYERRNCSSKKLHNELKLTLLVSGWAEIWTQVSLPLKSTQRHIGDPLPLHSSLEMSLRETYHHFESNNPNACPTPMCGPVRPSADSLWREAYRGSLWTIRKHSAILPLPLPPQQQPCLLCFRPADGGRRSKRFPRNQPPSCSSPSQTLKPNSLIKSGEASCDSTVSKAVTCPFTHYLLAKNIYICVLSGCHQIFFLPSILLTPFQIQNLLPLFYQRHQ